VRRRDPLVRETPSGINLVMPSVLPAPQPNADSIEYWQHAREGRLTLRECEECGARHYPPRHLCPRCWSQRLHWIDASGHGRIHTFTVIRRAPLPELVAHLPYVVALVDLTEGPRMMANIVGDDALDVAIGEDVELCFEPRGEMKLPQFRRAPR
jgi:uncharacterized OB-fold protein